MDMNPQPSTTPSRIAALTMKGFATASKTMNSRDTTTTTTPVLQALEVYNLPYGITGTLLHLLMYITLLLIAKHSISPLTLRQIRHHVPAAIICFISSTTAFVVVVVNALHTCRNIDVTSVVGYFAIQITMSLLVTVVTANAVLHKRRELQAAAAVRTTAPQDKGLVFMMIMGYVFGAAVGLMSIGYGTAALG